MLRMSRTTTSPAFTIPELLITMTVGAIIMALIFGPLNDLYDSNTQGVRSIVQASDARGALRQIEREISLTTTFLRQNNVADVTPSTSWNWRGIGSTNDPNNRVLITQNYGTAVIAGPARVVVTNSDCETVQSINYVYFVKNQSLYRRTLVGTSYPSTCDGVTIEQKRTCANLSDNTAHCQALDAKIVSGVTFFTVDYFAEPYSTQPLDNVTTTGTVTDHTLYSSATSTVPTTAKTVVLTLTITTGTGNNTVPMTTSLRITKINEAA